VFFGPSGRARFHISGISWLVTQAVKRSWWLAPSGRAFVRHTPKITLNVGHRPPLYVPCFLSSGAILRSVFSGCFLLWPRFRGSLVEVGPFSTSTATPILPTRPLILSPHGPTLQALRLPTSIYSILRGQWGGKRRRGIPRATTRLGY